MPGPSEPTPVNEIERSEVRSSSTRPGDEFEFITLDIDSATGLGGSAEPGDMLSFSIAGSLTIRGVTNEVVFDVEVTLSDESTVEGSVTTTVLRSDFDIGIPSVPGVAEVTDEVVLGLRFVAVAG